jgi:hypothetical protein
MQRAFTAHPAVHIEQFENLKETSPRAGFGIPGQFSDHKAVSVIRRHGAGVKSIPIAEPPANFSKFLRVVRMSIFPCRYL